MRLPDSEDIQRLIPDGTAPVARASDVSVGSGLQALGRGLNQIADRRASFEVASARSAFLSSKVEQDNAFDNDADYATIPERYEIGVREARDLAAEGITNPRARALFLEQTEPNIQAGIEAAQAKAFNIEADQGRAEINERLNQLNSAGLSGDPMDALTTMEDLLAGGLEAGYYSAEDAGRLDRAWRDKFATNRVMMLEPSRRLEALEQPWAANLPAEMRIELMAAAREDARRETAVDTLDDMLARGLSMTEMDREIRAIDDLDLRREVEARRDYEVRQRTAREAETADAIYEEWGDRIRFGQASVLDIPREQRRALKQSHLDALQSLERSSSGAIESDRGVIASFYELLGSGKVIEARDFVYDHAHELDHGDFKSFLAKTASAMGDGGRLDIESARTLNQSINSVIDRAGIKDDDAQGELLRKYDQSFFQPFQEQNGREPTDQERDEAVENLAREFRITRPGYWNDASGSAYEIEELGFIPERHIQAVLAGFGSEGERAVVSEERLESTYTTAMAYFRLNGVHNPSDEDLSAMIRSMRGQE